MPGNGRSHDEPSSTSPGTAVSSGNRTTDPERPFARAEPIQLERTSQPTPSTSGSFSASPRVELGKQIPRRPRVTAWLGVAFAFAFALLVTPAITADRWLDVLGFGTVELGQPAPYSVRVPPFAGAETRDAHVGGGGYVVARGEIATRAHTDNARAVAEATPHGPMALIAFFVLAFTIATIFAHHMKRSTRGRLVRVQIVSLVSIVMLAIATKVVMLTTPLSVLVVPVALFAMVPTMVLDRVVGLATGVLAALVVSFLGPFDLSVAILMLVQAATAGLVVAELPKNRWKSALVAGAVTTVLTVATYVLLVYLTQNRFPSFANFLHTPLFAASIGPLIATAVAVPLLPLYQLLVGEITHGKLVELEDLSNPLLRQISEKAPGTWQHSLMMANMAEIAANTIGANGRLVRVGAYYHDLGKSLAPKYFIENLEPGETSPHDQLPPEVSCDAIFSHVTEGIVTARRAGLHERIVDFMHMHHGNGVLEYFWGRCCEQGNPKGMSIEQFRYPGHPPQSRETAILAICDAVEAASRTLKKPDAKSIDALVQRIVYGKLHLGQLDESGLSMSDLRRVSDSLRETIKHANHGRIEYPWQKAQQDASASQQTTAAITGREVGTGPSPRLDSLDRKPQRDTGIRPAMDQVAEMIMLGDAEKKQPSAAIAETADLRKAGVPSEDLGIIETAPAVGTEHLRERPSKPSEPASASREGVWLRDAKDSSVVAAPPSITGDKPEAVPEPASDARADRRSRPPGPPPGARARSTTHPPPVAVRPTTTSSPPPIVPAAPGTLATPRSGSTTNAPPAGDRPASASQPPPDLITPATFGSPAARKRAATLPPTPLVQPPGVKRPTIPPLGMIKDQASGAVAMPPPASPPGDPAPEPPPRPDPIEPIGSSTLRGPTKPRPPASAPSTLAGMPVRPPHDARNAGPPAPVELENAVTNPPPLRRGTSSPPPATKLPGAILGPSGSNPRVPVTHVGHVPPRSVHSVGDDTDVNVPAVAPSDATRVGHAPGHDDASRTEPRMRKLELPLADRPDIAAHAESDEWGIETPVVPPTQAELRALLGAPDPTRLQSLDEIEALRLATQAEEPSDPEILQPQRRASKTTEVHPDDIEAAIELAPPARNRAPSAIAVAKPKKPE
ncbi:MAG TPA: HDIG domain-containing protein [Kofleriaceae bacterium]|nr:HDIG domain-containing protein [Kofleriaceae bacterium]